MTISDAPTPPFDVSKEVPGPPFYITKEEGQKLRALAERLSPALVIAQATSFDEFVRQLMIPPVVMDLARKASSIRLATWEIEGIRESLEPKGGGLLREILEAKAQADDSHPPYIRVACTGEGHYDELAAKYFNLDALPSGDYGSPAVLEIWPAQHYSPMHSHGGTTGIIYCLAGQIDVMAYEALDWNTKKSGLLTLTPGQCAWLAGDSFAVHRVYCPMDGGSRRIVPPVLLNETGEFAATFHVYLNKGETYLYAYEPKPDTRDIFEFIDERPPHKKEEFTTYSDLSWHILRRVLADYAAKTDSATSH